MDTVKARKLAYYGHTMRKQGNCLEKEIMQAQCPVQEGEEDHAQMDRQHQDVDRLSVEVNQNDGG